MISKTQHLLLALVLPLFFTVNSCMAQDTERKDICDSITVYYKSILDGLNSDLISYRLEQQLKKVKTIRNIKVNPQKSNVTFNVNTCINLTENQVRKLIYDAGAIPLEIKYSRDSTEVFPAEQPQQSF